MRSAILAATVLAMLLAAPAAQAQGFRFFGTYSLDGDRYEGTYLSFSLTRDGIADLAFRSTPLVDGAPMNITDASIRGATVSASGPDASVEIHDTPTGFIKVVAHTDVTLTWSFPDAVHADQDDGSVVLTRGVQAAVWSPDTDVRLAEGNATADLATGDSLLFRMRPGGLQFMSAYESDISVAAESGTVGAEAFVQGGPPSRTGHAVATYTEMTVLVRQHDGIELTVGSDLDEARTVVVRADQLALPGDGDLDVQVDDQAIEEAAGIQDVLDPADDAGPEYLHVQVQDSHVFLVSLPGFSVHEITIDRVAEFVQERPEVAALTVVTGIAVVTLAGFGMFKPRKRGGLRP